MLAIDSVGAGVGEKVLLVHRRQSRRRCAGTKAAAVDAAIIGIVDTVDYKD